MGSENTINASGNAIVIYYTLGFSLWIKCGLMLSVFRLQLDYFLNLGNVVSIVNVLFRQKSKVLKANFFPKRIKK